MPVYEVDAGGRCACGKECGRDAGKHPRTRHGFKDATTDASQITTWWTRWPNANIGIATGNGIAVVDVDTLEAHGHDGPATLATLEAAHGWLPETSEVATSGGGHHAYFRAPLGLKSADLGPGVELKAERAYVVAPPSRHRSGRPYSWRRALPATVGELPEIPLWPMMEIAAVSSTEKPGPSQAVPFTKRGRRYPAWFPEHLPVGIRHDRLKRLAGWFRGYGYDETAIYEELALVVTERVEQPPGDQIDDRWLHRLARAMAAKPVTRFGLRERYEPVANTWRGVAGRTDRKVLLRAVLPMVTRFRRMNGPYESVPIPSLTVATMADVSDRTAARSLHRLRERRQVLDYAGRRARVEDAQRYRLRPPPAPDSRSDEGLLVTLAMRSIALSRCAKLPDWDLYREIFLSQGLGPAAESVFTLLTRDVGQSAATLGQAAPCHISTAYRVLGRMAGHGLVAKGADGWRRLPTSRERLLEIATNLGVLGRIPAAKARRKVQRLVYHSAASQKRRQRDAAIRLDLQERLLAVAEARGWPRIGGVVGERAWRVHVKRTRTRALWNTLGLLTRGRRPTKAAPAALTERCVRQPARGRSS